MELCIKTVRTLSDSISFASFNPCFNGTMYKNSDSHRAMVAFHHVSILVLMELCIKTYGKVNLPTDADSFNPCFNGTMYKNI